METVEGLGQLFSHYRNKRVLVTGHTGFKGSWLLALLNKLGAKVKGYALESEHPEGLYNLLEPLKIAESVIADIRDKARLKEEILSFEPDFVFHLAAQPLVRKSYEIPSETFEINVIGTANLLECICCLTKKCTIIVITTDKVYQNKETEIAYKEDDILGGFDPYSASKACTEMVVNSFRSSFFNFDEIQIHAKRIATVRAGNVIGGGDWSKDRIIPDLIRSFEEGKTLKVRNPYAVRPWQHVLEPLSGYLLLGCLLDDDSRNLSNSYNFGPFLNDHLTVGQLVDLVIRKWPGVKWKEIRDEFQLHEAGLLKLDISKAQRELGWRPKLNATESINWTIDWYRTPNKEKVGFTFEQINQFFSL